MLWTQIGLEEEIKYRQDAVRLLARTARVKRQRRSRTLFRMIRLRDRRVGTQLTGT